MVIRIKHCVSGIVILCILMVSVSFAVEHPSEAYVARKASIGFGNKGIGFAAADSLGDLTFTDADPAPETLSETERYMLFGADNPGGGPGIGSWRHLVLSHVIAYGDNFNEIPRELNLDALNATTPEGYKLDEEGAQIYKNPLTGEWARTDAIEFSPGNLYIKLLNQDEIDHFAGISPILNCQWNLKRMWDNSKRRPGSQRVSTTKCIVYVRMYGVSEVIYNGLFFVYWPEN